MNKFTLILIAVGLTIFLGNGNILAGINKPPSSACYSLGAFINEYDSPYVDGAIALAFKSNGMKIRSANGTVKFYHVVGKVGKSPFSANESVSGSATWNSISGEMDGHLWFGNPNYPIHCDIYLNTSPLLYCAAFWEDGPHTTYFRLNEVDCRLVTITQ